MVRPTPLRLPQAALLVAALAVAGAAPGCGGDGAELPERPSLLLVTLDTLRADHLGLYGYFRDTSPHLDRLAADALVFERAFAPMSTTLPAHASLMTGVHPIRHGVVSNFRFFGRGVSGEGGLRTAAEMLGERGWQTAAFTSASPLSEETGIGRGFDHFQGPGAWSAERRRLEVPALETAEAARAWLAGARAPFFLWVHFFDPHHPYEAPPPFSEAFSVEAPLADHLRERGFPADLRPRLVGVFNAYDGEIAYTDHAVGTLLDALRERGLWDETLIVVVGDHGEGLWQHAHGRHGLTWNEQIRVPLVVRIPGGPRGRHEGLASLMDVLPTLAAHARLPFDRAQLDGVDLLEERRRSVLAQRVVRRSRPDPVLALVSEEWKYWRGEDGAERLFHLPSDPHELRDVLAEQPEAARTWRRRLEERVAGEEARAAVPVEESMPREVREQLRALGYVE